MTHLLPSRRAAPSSTQLVISFGAAHVAGARVGWSGGRITAGRYAREELNPDPEGDGDWAVRAGRALARLARAQHWRGEATVILPGHLTLTKRVRTPAVGDAGRETALLFAAQQNLPEALGNLTWDGVVLSDDGTDLDLLLGTARTAVVETVVDAVVRAELKVAHIRPPGLPPPGPWMEPGQSCVFANIGARSTLLSFHGAGGWWTRRIGTAGNSVTRLMARGLDADFARAQRLKHETATDRNDPGLASIRQGARREFAELLAAEIRRTALTYGCSGGSDRPDMVWLAGGGSRLPQLGSVLSDVLDRPVHRAQIGADLTFATPTEEGEEAGLADILSVVGCPNPGKERERPAELGPIVWPDLLPWRMKLAQSAARRRRAAVVAVTLLALAPFPVAWSYGQRASDLAVEQARLEGQLVPKRREAAAQRTLTARLEAGRTELAVWQRLDAQAASWPEFLGGLEAAANDVGGVWLERLARVPSTGRPDGQASSGPRQIALAGRLQAAQRAPAAAMDEASFRMRRLAQAFGRLPDVAGVTGERFDRRAGTDLRFECVLILKTDSFL
ncbi:MAG: hypothetical protein RL324_557 [Verrucomicrobiota bacterium]|jgi:type IV pilus assembly protein PilM